VASEQQKLRTAFEQLQQFLREQEGALLAQLDGAHARLSEQHREYTCRVSERGTLLEELVEEIQKKRDQPAVEFLMVRLWLSSGVWVTNPGVTAAPHHCATCWNSAPGGCAAPQCCEL